MTQFRSRKDGSHYPISGGRVIYPKGYDEWKDKAMVYKDGNHWWITYHDGVTGPYKSKKEAIEYSASSGNTLYEERLSDGALVKIYPVDNRNLYGGQYRMSQELADAINKNLEFSSATGGHHAHNMSAYEDRNHFDVSNILINEGIHREKLIQINKEANEGNPKLWNTIREDLLCDGVVKLGEKYGVPLEKPLRIDAYGNIRLMVVQDNPQIRRMMHE